MATLGRLYAGDLNAIQDLAAAESDFAQTIDVLGLRVGDTGLSLVKYGAGEFRLTGNLRTDGIVRALGGLYGGAFTTTQRDAITAGSRPYGLLILNTTTNRYEWNAGTDAAPNWQPLVNIPQAVPAGAIFPFGGSAAPSGYLLCQGQAVSRATYSVLFAAISTLHGVGDGSTTFNMPDMRGRMPVGLGTHGDIDAIAENEGRPVANRRPRHRHTVNDPGHRHAYQNPLYHSIAAVGSHQMSENSNLDALGMSLANTGISVGADPTNDPLDAPAYYTLQFIISTGQ